MGKDIKKSLEVIKRGTAEIIPEDELIKKLKKGKPLRIKLGIDASGPDIHLGFSVVLRKLRDFQELGHIAVLIVGDFTGKIGDPSGRSKTRPQLTDEEIKKNMKNYSKQVFKILIKEKTEFRYNSEWNSKLTPAEIIKLASKTTVARMLERDDFSNRYKAQQPIFLHEFLYPIFQAYDSVAIKADVEIGGTDQTFNFMIAREMMREMNMEPQVILTMPLLVGLDGKMKMSKSYGNYIGIMEPPEEMFGKVMSIPDELIENYFELVLCYPNEAMSSIRKELKRSNPRDLKFRLATEIVSLYHNKDKAKKSAEEFERVFKLKKLPTNIPELIVNTDSGSIWIVKLLTTSGMANTNSEARRLIEQGGVEIANKKITDTDATIKLEEPFIMKVGKRRFLKIIPGKSEKI
ncbi:MAG: tyrosine--tRNA ligase [Candidatus Cloacimonas sp. 4484_209]|nr:MAG: tyrosine--tRNA ligase [Candidatus Cloacimonas sp. 4484_209]